MCLGRWKFGRGARARLRGFGQARGGNIAIMWGLMGAILMGLVGLTVDFTRAQTIQAQMQNAADGAALVAERLSNLTLEERQAAAEAFFNAEMGNFAGDIDFDVAEMETGGHEARASYLMPLGLSHLIRDEDWTIGVVSEAQAQASPPIEVVMALDNTGSMANDMDTLREGAADLAEFLLSLDGDTVSVGIVPFVAQVNIGSANTAWMDTTGVNPLHGVMMENRYIGYRSTTSSACTNATNYPSAYGGFSIVWVRGNASNPAPYTNTGRCYAFSASSINLFTVFNNLPATAAWAGCVEARPIPYDISDDAPVIGTPATMFVPYFAMDEGGDDTDTNNWLTNSSYDRAAMINIATSTLTYQSGVRSWGVYKYRSGVSVSIDTTGSDAKGPNRGCPTAITPLTTDDNTVFDAIEAMEATYGGGTNQIEGLVWAWRAISPSAPFTQGRSYDDPDDPVRKVIVLFTDGDNTSLQSSNNAFESEYSAMGFRSLYRNLETARTPVSVASGVAASWGYGVPSAYRRSISPLNGVEESGWGAVDADETTMVAYMNARQGLLCTAIKNAGIEVYTIGFDIEEGGTADQLLENCATQDGEHYYHADDQSELLEAFDAIGSGIGELRITR